MKKIAKTILAMLPMLTVGFVCGLLIGKYALEAESRGVPGGVLGAVAVLFAGFVLASIPMILLFSLNMKNFISGITSGAIKG